MLRACLLRKISYRILSESLAEYDLSRKRRDQSEQGFHKRGLSGAVLSDNTEVIPRLHAEIESFKHGLSLISERKTAANKLRHLSFPFAKSRLFGIGSNHQYEPKQRR